MSRRISGTKEWSTCSVNIALGCPHRCRYCYARANALRFNRLERAEDWGEAYFRVREAEVRKRRKRVEGTVMFPTTHDITPEILDPCLEVIRNILEAGNRLLIVSKPHEECIAAICLEFGLSSDPFTKQILFRFTIGAMDDGILSYWEPGAPSFAKRKGSLIYAQAMGFQTSVSIEPMLDSDNVVDLFHALEPYVTDTIWIGKLNKIRQRCIAGTDRAEIERIEAGQTDERIRAIYWELNAQPKVRWKDSFKQVLGLDLAPAAGMDV